MQALRKLKREENNKKNHRSQGGARGGQPKRIKYVSVFFTLLEVRICNETKKHQQNSPHKQEVKEKIEVPQTTHSHTHTLHKLANGVQ